MTCGTSHLLIAGEGGVILRERGQEKKMLCKGGHFMKNKNIGGMCFVNSTCSAKKAPINAQKNAKYYQTLKNFSSLVSLTRHFTKLIFLEQLTAMPKFNMQNIFFSKQSS